MALIQFTFIALVNHITIIIIIVYNHLYLHFFPSFFVVLSTMNMKYRTTLSESKKLNASGLLQRATASHITADKILYDHAIQMVSDIEMGFICTTEIFANIFLYFLLSIFLLT